MPGLKPRPISEARARATATADPYGMTNKKGNDKYNNKGWPGEDFAFPLIAMRPR